MMKEQNMASFFTSMWNYWAAFTQPTGFFLLSHPVGMSISPNDNGALLSVSV